jgi:hypothetical protein
MGPLLTALTVIAAISWIDDNDISPAGVFIFLLVIGVPIALFALIVRALIRVGNKRPPAVIIQQPTTASPPPGFYTDESGTRRWFDGEKWTDVKE